MSERRKNAQETVVESDKQFLERTGASHQIKDVLAKIIENRPEDPLSFLADYFDGVGDKVVRVAKAHEHINLTHHSRPAFDNNVRVAYDVLSQTKVGKHLRGVSGVVYGELLQLLCRTFTPVVTERLLKKIRCRDHEVVVYTIFRSGVFTCLVLRDYIQQAEDLFRCLDPTGTGKVDRLLCEGVLAQLKEAISISGDNPTSVLQAGYMLGPDKLHEGISKTILQTTSNKKVMTIEEFSSAAADSFISKVKAQK